jgi:Ca2+-binding RTX toxin-like protein
MRRASVILAVLGMVLLPAARASADVRAEFALGILTVSGDGQANEILVECVNGNVRVNDTAPTGGRVRCGNVTSLLVRAGDGPDRIDLTDVRRSAFDVLLEIGVFGEAGNDTLVGSDLADQLDGGGGVDVLRGGAGMDGLLPGGGGGELVGGEGRDRAAFFGDGEWLVNEQRVAHVGPSEETTLRGVEIVTIAGGDGADVVTGAAFSGVLVLRGGRGADELTSGAGRDHLLGGPGNDVLVGGDGNDLLEGEQGRDELRGGDGNDQLLGGAGQDTCIGGDGADSQLSC